MAKNTKEEVKKFNDFLRSNPNIAKALKEVKSNDQWIAKYVSIAHENGYSFTEADIKSVAKEANVELSDMELGHVAGGGGSASATCSGGLCTLFMC